MKIFFDVIGCRLNQSEVEGFANLFRALGHQVVSDPSHADLAIVNTCAVTVKAAADSRKKLRRASRLGAPRVIATGCWATLYPQEARALSGVTGVCTNDSKEHLITDILELDPEVASSLNLVREPLPGDRARTRAFIKVQEGCDNYCTYCLTRLARGKSHSRKLPEIQRDIQAAVAGKAKEIVLSGVQLGAWGRDLSPPKGLENLLEGVLKMDGFNRLRFSSIEPWDFPLELLDFWKERRLCRHLHIPLQSGSDATLRAMGRPTTTGLFFDLIDSIREAVPEIAITTDIITGFPGETENDFAETKDFLHRIGFAGGHVFTYSPRPGTAAYLMKPGVPMKIAKARNAAVREIFKEGGHAYRDKFIGTQIPVLWEFHHQSKDCPSQLSGLTDTYIRVYANAEGEYWNQISLVSLERHHSQRDALIGQIIAS
ncbi:MAG: MiaB/RimO family radical SAM methylthiotransferase [Chloroflexota bacterium]|nr:MiaB/RimO family radical SAM methylthiotransferase [Chloroflexota bacterium]